MCFVALLHADQFDCPSLSGAELELPTVPAVTSLLQDDALVEDQFLDDASTTHFCIGSHWSRRLFQSDLMNPVVDYLSMPLNLFNSMLLNNTSLFHY